jgi:hypothetical protein
VIYQTYRQESGALLPHIRVQEFQSLIHDRTRNFIGREFVFQAIDDLLADPNFPAGYIVIQGEPGIGKTAVAAQLVKTKGYPHHFNIAPQNIRSPRDFLANICAQLITQFELAYFTLPEKATRDSGFLAQLLHESAAKATDQPVVVLVDALDEAEDVGLTADANRLFLPSTLPDNVFFIVTTREQADYRLFVNGRRDIYLRDDDPGNVEDVRQYVRHYLESHADVMEERIQQWQVTADEFVDVVTDKSQGNFMYLIHVLRDIRTEKLTAATIDNIHRLPQGLRAYYQRHWRAMRAQDEDRFEKVYEPVVCYLATAREPVGIGQLVLWTKLPPPRIKEVIDEWREFLNTEEGEQGEPLHRIYHASFQDFLKDEVGLTHYHDGIAQTALDKIEW